MKYQNNNCRVHISSLLNMIKPTEYYSAKQLREVGGGDSYTVRHLIMGMPAYHREERNLNPFPRVFKIQVYKGLDLTAKLKAMKKKILDRDAAAVAKEELKKKLQAEAYELAEKEFDDIAL